MASVRLTGVTVTFPVFSANAKSLRANLLYFGSGGVLARDARGHVTISALKEVGLKAVSGDRIALVGRNGSGKTTLLKVIGGIYMPTRGSALVDGRASPVLGGGLGVDEDLSGYEAIEYGCLLRGIPADRIPQVRAEVADFTELGDYLSMPVRTYSAGMKMRLAFAVATCDMPDVLLVDEGIAAGDIFFMQKARRRASAFLRESSILFLASHDEGLLRNICNKAILLDRGEIVAGGAVEEVLQVYHRLEEPPRAAITVSALEGLPEGTDGAIPSPRPIASSSLPDHGPGCAFDGAGRTYWLSDPAFPVRETAFIGLDFGPGHAIEVRQVTIRQWSGDPSGGNCVSAVAVQLSDDGFMRDVRTATTIALHAGIGRQSHSIPPSGPTRSWRVLALSDTVGGGPWGILELDFDSIPAEDWPEGRPISSEPAAPNVPARAAFDDNPFTHWTSAERAEATVGVSWIGYDFGPGQAVEVRSFTIRQWDGGERPNTVSRVKVQHSSDGFVADVHTADVVSISQTTARKTYPVAPSAKSRFWRVLAASATGGGHWGVIELRFSGRCVVPASPQPRRENRAMSPPAGKTDPRMEPGCSHAYEAS